MPGIQLRFERRRLLFWLLELGRTSAPSALKSYSWAGSSCAHIHTAVLSLGRRAPLCRENASKFCSLTSILENAGSTRAQYLSAPQPRARRCMMMPSYVSLTYAPSSHPWDMTIQAYTGFSADIFWSSSRQDRLVLRAPT